MDKLIIAGIELPVTTSLEVGGDLECKEKVMASGLLVRDVIGFRKKLTARWEWIPVEVLTQLTAMVRTGVYLEIQYPDPVEGDSRGLFDVSIGSAKIFRFNNGMPRWYNVELSAKAQEVS